VASNSNELSSSANLSGRRFEALVVDDHPFVRLALKNTLLQQGVESVIEAADGDDALAKINANQTAFDLIFCDLQMPGRDGIETLRAFAELGIRACIVLMSGEDASILASAVTLAHSHGLRLLGHAAKPITAEQIRYFLAAADTADVPKRKESTLETIEDIDIRRGILHKEFFVEFQPKVSVKNRDLRGVEALVRWRHPHHGLIPPITFIDVAEQSSTIDLLTDYVLIRAIEAQKLWASQGVNVDIAVNLSTCSMARLNIPDRFAGIVTSLEGNPATILFEVTESRLVDDLATFLETATRLRLKGFRLSIDDFGTGYSTLEQLSRLPVSELKIDRAFVAGTPENARTRTILRASIILAQSLHLTTICEGAETETEWNLVRDLGADCVQGYYVARPMPPGEILNWYNSWR